MIDTSTMAGDGAILPRGLRDPAAGDLLRPPSVWERVRRRFERQPIGGPSIPSGSQRLPDDPLTVPPLPPIITDIAENEEPNFKTLSADVNDDRYELAPHRELRRYIQPDGTPIEVEVPVPPWVAMCLLYLNFPGGRFRGTGWFIGNRTIMTAAHNLYSWEERREDRRQVQSIDVIAATTEGNKPFPLVPTSSFDYHPRWEQETDEQAATEYDYGAIFLNDPWLGNQIGTFLPFLALQDSQWAPEVLGKINVSGYPKQWGEKLVTAPDSRFGLHSEFRGIVIHKVDTTEGESGGPIYHYSAKTGRNVIGIHTDGFGTFGPRDNAGVRITGPLAEQMRRWIANPVRQLR